MTDGIIQQTFKEHLRKNDRVDNQYEIVLSELQQELIAKIKQERHVMNIEPTFAISSCCGWFEYIHLEKLIGDNQK